MNQTTAPYAGIARELQSKGRDGDTVLVHMTPNEVNSLQGLALAAGGSLTLNPETGLVEASFLKNLLPMLLGVGLNFILPGSGLAIKGLGTAAQAGLMTGAGYGLATGSLEKGLMAGLGAFGGASLAGAAGLGGAGAAKTAATSGVDTIAQEAASQAAKTGVQAGAQAGAGALGPGQFSPEILQQAAAQKAALTAKAPGLGGGFAPGQASMLPPTGAAPAVPQGLLNSPGAMLPPQGGVTMAPGAQAAMQAPATDASRSFFQRFGDASREGMPKFLKGAAPLAAGYGVLAPFLEPQENPDIPGVGKQPTEKDIPRYAERRLDPRVPTGDGYRENPYRGELDFFGGTNRFTRLAAGDEVRANYPQQVPQDLNSLIALFRTSPGPVQNVPFGYGAGNAPSDRARAMGGGAPGTPAVSAPSGAAGGLANPNLSIDLNTGAPMNFFPNRPAPTPAGGIPQSQRSILEGLMRPGLNTARPPMGGGLLDVSPAFESNRLLSFAKGGQVNMESGGFVMPARETAEFGNGSTNAGQRRLAAMGGRPIRGSGDGVSDSIPANIDGRQRAAVADGEVYFPPQAVKRLGGPQKLRAMMRAAEKSRKKAPRGKRGLA